MVFAVVVGFHAIAFLLQLYLTVMDFPPLNDENGKPVKMKTGDKVADKRGSSKPKKGLR